MIINNIFVVAGDRMRSEQFGFLNSDVSNIDKVIEALHELVSINFKYEFNFT